MGKEGGAQYGSDDGEFSLPEGVDLVGVDGRKSNYMPYQQHPRSRKPPLWKTALKLVLINVFVCALVLGYALMGSFVFLALENNRGVGSSVLASTMGVGGTGGGNGGGGPNGHQKRTNLTTAIMNSLHNEQVQQLKSDTVRNIWDITLSMNILYPDNWTKMTNEEVSNFQRFLLEKVITAVENATTQEYSYPWTFPRAFLFALTTLTTIGYGGIGPKTSSGKIATMVYAVFGIPIMLWYLSNVGSLLAKIVRFFCSKICGCCFCQEPSSPPHHNPHPHHHSSSTPSTRKVDPYFNGGKPMTEGDLHHLQHQQHRHTDHQHHRLSCCVIFVLCILVLLGYLCFGAWVVAQSEKWHFLDSFYFCFLTLTTISFGDSRSQKTGRLDKFKLSTEWFCSFYILFGMALTSMFFNILHEEISIRFKQWKHNSPLDNNGSTGGSGPLLEGGNNKGLKQVENSYSVHFMNFSSPKTTASRNYTTETLISSNEVHRGLANTESSPKGGGVGGGYDDEEEIPQNDFMGGGGVNAQRSTMYSPNVHPVFPR